MKTREVRIAKARIEGLIEENFSYNVDCDNFKTKIYFSQIPEELNNIVTITCGESHDTAKVYHSNLIQQLNSAQIYNRDNVIVIYSDYGNLIAIGKPGLNQWIDVEDNFRVKTFGNLNIIITELTVY